MPIQQAPQRDQMFSGRNRPDSKTPVSPSSLDQYLATTNPAHSHRGVFILVAVLLFVVIFFGWYLLRRPSSSTSGTVQAPGLLERIFGNGTASNGTVSPDDPDRDGLALKQEKELGTDSAKADTDADGLTDREEANVYKTNPLSEDTDKDSISDGAEISQRTDPLNPDPKAVWPPLPPQIGVNR